MEIRPLFFAGGGPLELCGWVEWGGGIEDCGGEGIVSVHRFVCRDWFEGGVDDGGVWMRGGG
eukprot:CCRYP_002354-RA/>CCRYP_002354-RA protein AED:0.30 eAED:0.39 QI:0/0/0.5/1/0/0/2/644/61